MPHRRIAGRSPYETIMGYSRAVVAGNHVYVAGTAPIPAEGDPPEGGYEQARLCLRIILEALERAGASAEDVVRTCIYLVDPSVFDEVALAHGEVFADIRPVNTTVLIPGLVDPRWLLEIDALAVIQGEGAA